MTTHAQLSAFPGWDWGDGRNGIGWCDETVNPIRGCTAVSAGCANCYAEQQAARVNRLMAAQGRPSPYDGLVVEKSTGWTWSGNVAFNIRALDKLKRRPPQRVFIGSMTDLFQDAVPDEWLDEIFAFIRAYTQHLYWVLTKRPKRMAEYSQRNPFPANVWAGVSVENQETANERIPWLAEVAGGGTDGSAPRTWLSYEPALGSVDLKAAFNSQWPTDDQGVRELGPDLVIAGGESGPDARPAHPDWFRSMRDQCDRLGVPYRHKQNGPKAAGRLLDDEEHLPLPPLPVTP